MGLHDGIRKRLAWLATRITKENLLTIALKTIVTNKRTYYNEKVLKLETKYL